MKVVVGLGNPGSTYAGTRHNVGFAVVEALLQMQKSKIKNQNDTAKFKMNKKFGAEMAQSGDLLFAKPQKYMNKSGEVVQRLVRFYDVDLNNLWVVHDDLDIRLGEYKIVLGKGPKEHNGVNSVERALGATDFWRVRVGVDSRREVLRLSGGSNTTRSAQDDSLGLMSLSSESSRKIPGEMYVLSRFSKTEKELIDGLLPQIVDDVREKMI